MRYTEWIDIFLQRGNLVLILYSFEPPAISQDQDRYLRVRKKKNVVRARRKPTITAFLH
jgi:hypothetical protein